MRSMYVTFTPQSLYTVVTSVELVSDSTRIIATIPWSEEVNVVHDHLQLGTDLLALTPGGIDHTIHNCKLVGFTHSGRYDIPIHVDDNSSEHAVSNLGFPLGEVADILDNCALSCSGDFGTWTIDGYRDINVQCMCEYKNWVATCQYDSNLIKLLTIEDNKVVEHCTIDPHLDEQIVHIELTEWVDRGLELLVLCITNSGRVFDLDQRGAKHWYNPALLPREVKLHGSGFNLIGVDRELGQHALQAMCADRKGSPFQPMIRGIVSDGQARKVRYMERKVKSTKSS